MKPFYTTLFNEGESVCWSKDIYGTSVSPVATADMHCNRNFLCINPLRNKRADAECTALRNILIEFDGIDLDAQRKLVEMCELPYSTCVFSGSKSYHYVISLETALPDLTAYKALVRRIYSKVPGLDTANSNPSRFSRNPGADRDGTLQELIVVKPRVLNSELEAWLGPEPARAVVERTAMRGHRVLSGFTNHFLMFGAEPGERNKKLFSAACDMLRAGYASDEIVIAVERVLTLDPKEVKETIRSAQRAVRSET